MCINRSDGMPSTTIIPNTATVSNRTNNLTRVGPPSSSTSSSSYSPYFSSFNSHQLATEKPAQIPTSSSTSSYPTQLYPLSAIPYLDSLPSSLTTTNNNHSSNSGTWTNTRLEPRPDSFPAPSSDSISSPAPPPSASGRPNSHATVTDTPHREQPPTTIDRHNTYSYSIVDNQGTIQISGPSSRDPFIIPIADSNVVESKHDHYLTVDTETPPPLAIASTPGYYEAFDMPSPIVTQKPQSFQLPEQKNVIRVTLTSSGMTAGTAIQNQTESAEVIPIFYRPRDNEKGPTAGERRVEEEIEEMIEPTTYSPVDFRMPTQRYPTPFTAVPTKASVRLEPDPANRLILSSVAGHSKAAEPVELRKLQRGTFPPEYTVSSTKPTYLITTLKGSAADKGNRDQTRNSISDSIQSFTSRNQIFKESLNKTFDSSFAKHTPHVSPYQSLRTLLDNEVAMTTTTAVNRPESNSSPKNNPPPTRSYFLITAPPEMWPTEKATAERPNKFGEGKKPFYFFKTKDNVDLTTKPLKNYVFYSTPNSIDVEPTTYVPKSRFVPKQEAKGSPLTTTTTTIRATARVPITTTTRRPIETTTTTSPPVSVTTTPSTTTTEILTKRKIIRMRFQLKNKKKFTTTELPLVIDPEDDDNFESATQPIGNNGEKEQQQQQLPSTPFSYNPERRNKHRFSTTGRSNTKPPTISNFSITNNTENLAVRSNFMRTSTSPNGRVVEITDKPVYYTGFRKPPPRANTEDLDDETQWKPIVDPKIQLLENSRQKFRATVEMPEFNIPTESELAAFVEADEDENSNQIEDDGALNNNKNNRNFYNTSNQSQKTDPNGGRDKLDLTIVPLTTSTTTTTKTFSKSQHISSSTISSSTRGTTTTTTTTSRTSPTPTSTTTTSPPTTTTTTTGKPGPNRFSRINPAIKSTISATLPRRTGFLPPSTTTSAPAATTIIVESETTEYGTPSTPAGTMTTTTTGSSSGGGGAGGLSGSSGSVDGSSSDSSSKAKCIDSSANSKCTDNASRYLCP